MNWEFVYLGADLEDFSDADRLGMQSASFRKKDLQQVFEVLNEESTYFRLKNISEDKASMKDNILKKFRKPEK